MGDAKRAVATSAAKPEYCDIVTGELLAVVDGRPIVRMAAGAPEGVPSASIVPVSEYYNEDGSLLVGCSVMIALRGPASAPVVLGVIRDRLAPRAEKKRDEKTVLVDGERIVLQGSREIVLKCGESEILLRSDGKVVVKGCDVVSRASRRNRIKGATVGIN